MSQHNLTPAFAAFDAQTKRAIDLNIQLREISAILAQEAAKPLTPAEIQTSCEAVISACQIIRTRAVAEVARLLDEELAAAAPPAEVVIAEPEHDPNFGELAGDWL